MSEKSMTQQQARLVGRTKISRRNSADLAGVCSGEKIIRSLPRAIALPDQSSSSLVRTSAIPPLPDLRCMRVTSVRLKRGEMNIQFIANEENQNRAERG